MSIEAIIAHGNGFFEIFLMIMAAQLRREIVSRKQQVIPPYFTKAEQGLI
ncbi:MULTISPECIES: hypothetical protein [Eisenbergiella]|nr:MULTISPECIES: hypothetical protein [Eisenbergiella]